MPARVNEARQRNAYWPTTRRAAIDDFPRGLMREQVGRLKRQDILTVTKTGNWHIIFHFGADEFANCIEICPSFPNLLSLLVKDQFKLVARNAQQMRARRQHLYKN